jgi:hypothetical protein
MSKLAMSRPPRTPAEVRELMRAVSSKLEPGPMAWSSIPKSAYEIAAADVDTWESEGGACVPLQEQTVSHNDPYQSELHKCWSKCPFCGATNGKHDSVLQQHRPRCRWMGDADKFDAMHPNYSQMIAEDDTRHLPMMHAQSELEHVKHELAKIQKRDQ